MNEMIATGDAIAKEARKWLSWSSLSRRGSLARMTKVIGEGRLPGNEEAIANAIAIPNDSGLLERPMPAQITIYEWQS
jgi:hypothetical protein